MPIPLSKKFLIFISVCSLTLLIYYISYTLNFNLSIPISQFKIYTINENEINSIRNKWNYTNYDESNTNTFKLFKIGSRSENSRGALNLALVLCDSVLEKALVNIKSALFLSKASIHLILFTDNINKPLILEKISKFPKIYLKKLSFEMYPISLPNNNLTSEWRNLWKPCASQRLFFPALLPHLDSVVYVDADSLFLRPFDEIWSYFSKMNSTQIAGMSPESEDFATGWYNRFARHPYYEPLGLNSGVMLMNLTRMRAFNWTKYIEPTFHKYRLNIVWGDQDIINIIFHFHPDKLFLLGCDWNYRPDHCMYSSVCKNAEAKGVAILHGNRNVFVNDKEPVFKTIFQVWNQFQLNEDPKISLLQLLSERLEEHQNSNCGKMNTKLTQGLHHYIY